MLAPAFVDDGEHDAAFEFAGRILTEFFLSLGVEHVEVGLDLRIESVLREVSKSAEFLGEVFGGDRRCIDLAEGFEEFVDLPVLDRSRGRLGNVGVDDLFAEVRDLLFEIGAVEDSATFVVDDGALAVEYVVVFEDVLALFGVALFDLLTGRERMARVTIFDSSGTSSGTLAVAMMRSAAPEPNRRMRSSVSDR